jgi:HEAT repeat protein
MKARKAAIFLLFGFCLTLLPVPVMAQSQNKTVSVQGLIFDLKHPEADRRVEAARLLGSNKIRQAVPALVEAADDPDPRVRMAIVTALDDIRDIRAQPVLVKMVQDPETDIRKKAIDALVDLYVLDESGFIAGTKKVFKFLNPFDSNYNDLIIASYINVPADVIDALVTRLNDSDDGVRKAAVMSLGIFRARPALPNLERASALEKKDDIKVEFIRTFYKIGDPAACSSVLPLINDPDKGVHDEAILTAGLLRCRDAVEPLMYLYESGIKERKTVLKIIPASSSYDLQLKCFQALALIADPRSEKLFLPALRHSNDDFRVAAAEGVARLGNRDNLARVQQHRATASHRRYQLALDYALFRLGQENLLNELVQELDSSRYGDQVYNYLLELTPDQLPRLYPLLRSSTGDVRVRLLDVLGMIGDAGSLDVVRTYTNDSDPDVVSAALLAVRRLQARR